VLCSKCFKNEGLRAEARQVNCASSLATACPNCGQQGGVPLDETDARNLALHFFVHGSIPPEAGGPAPVYQFNNARPAGEVEFGTELDEDLSLLERHGSGHLFHYGPPIWRLGYTEHYQRLRFDAATLRVEERKEIWAAIMARCSVRTLEETALIYRMRAGGQMPEAIAASFDTAPPGVRKPGRYDTDDLPILYAAEDVETCLHECRVTLADWICVATFAPARPLRVLDLSRDIDDRDARTEFDRVDLLLRRMAYAGKADYDLCKELAAEIHARGFDGFFFESYFAQVHSKELRNLGLFGYPVRDGKLSLKSVNRVCLSSVAYDYSFGPHDEFQGQAKREALVEYAERLRTGELTDEDALAEFERITRRRLQS
jgi:hypothetical protein